MDAPDDLSFDPTESDTADVFQRLARSARTVHLLTELFAALILTGLAFTADLLVTQKPGWWLPEPGVAAASFGAFLVLRAFVYPFFWYRSWRYAVREHDVLICFGVLWRVKRSVPRRRIQHVDIHSGPIDRAFGLCGLTLYTAGSGDENAGIPGLLAAHAEALRDRLLNDDD